MEMIKGTCAHPVFVTVFSVRHHLAAFGAPMTGGLIPLQN